MGLADFGLDTRYVRIRRDEIVGPGVVQDEIILHRCDSFSTDVGGEASMFRTVAGNEVSDSVTATARRITIEGAWTDTPGLILGGVSAFRDGVQSLFFPRMPATRHLLKLEEWKDRVQLVKVVTASRTYSNMVVLSVARVDDQPRAEVKVSIILQEIRTVITAVAPAELDPEAQALEDAGNVQLQEFTPGALVDPGFVLP
jgi:hypothetical protein